jgi:CubicO group peptidase (beta-lactamase class C family)
MPAGDPELTAKLGALAGRGTRSLAVALIDTQRSDAIRCAFIDADAGMRFEIGSVTKGLTGMLLADAIERGELSLQTDVGMIYQDSVSTEFGSVTMQELCTHTSGLPKVAKGTLAPARALRSLLLQSDPYRGSTPRGVLALAAHQPLFEHGRYRYSNLGAAAIGELLAMVAGHDYASLLRERILLPLGLEASFVSSADNTAPKGWSSSGRPQQPWIMDGYAPAGAVVSTITDMAQLAVSLLRGSAPGQGSLAPIDGVATSRSGRGSGMFWVIDAIPGTDHSMIWHNGQTGGYSAFFGLFPDAGRAVIVLANVARPADTERIALTLIGLRADSP